MKKRIITSILTVILVLSMSVCAFAGQWVGDYSTGWIWLNDDGSFPVNQWVWIDDNGDNIAECYYFDENGFCMTATTAPDGSEVNADGAWIIDGEVQHQPASTFIDTSAVQAVNIRLDGSGSGWGTTINLYADGSFEGDYEYKPDINLSHAAQDYSYVTFTGYFTNFHKINDYEYSMEMGTINTIPAGVDVNGLDGKEYILYLPGAYLGDLDIILNWTTSRYGEDIENVGSISAYFLVSQKNGVNLASIDN